QNKGDNKMKKLSINENSTIMECYEHFELHHNHAANTKVAYSRNCQSFHDFMKEKGIDPSVKNIGFSLAKSWKVSLQELSFADTTIKQMIASLKKLNNYLINLGILTANVFNVVDEKSVSSSNHHSRALSLSELYQVYKTAIELDSDG